MRKVQIVSFVVLGILATLVLGGCPAGGAGILGVWNCASYTPATETTSYSQVTFYANGEAYIYYPSSGNLYTLFYTFDGQDILIFGEDTFATTEGLLVVSQSSALTLTGPNTITGQTWQTVSLNGGQGVVVYSTEVMTRQ